MKLGSGQVAFLNLFLLNNAFKSAVCVTMRAGGLCALIYGICCYPSLSASK